MIKTGTFVERENYFCFLFPDDVVFFVFYFSSNSMYIRGSPWHVSKCPL